MRTSRTGYLMAMLAGLAIVGASTGGVVAATSHHDRSTASAASVAAPSADNSDAITAPPATSAATTPDITTDQPPLSPSTTSSEQPAPAPSSGSSVPPRAPTRPATVPRSAAGTTVTSATATSTTAAAKHQFKDGQYTATGSYNSPGGIEKLGVTLTLSADKVTKSTLDLQGGAGLSHSFQSAFESGYSPQVIGKDIASISLGAVSGSSLTGLGFNDALKQIESKARLQQ